MFSALLVGRRLVAASQAGASSLFAASSMMPIVSAHVTARFFGHGRDKFAANGSKRFKKGKANADPTRARKSVRIAHKMRRIVARRQREAERAKLATVESQKNAAAAAAAAKSAADRPLTEEERRAALLRELPIPEGIEEHQLRFGMQSWMVDELHPAIRKMLEYRNASNAEVVHRRKLNWAVKLGGSEANTGDTAVQSTSIYHGSILFSM